jgi:hypothetical protein
MMLSRAIPPAVPPKATEAGQTTSGAKMRILAPVACCYVFADARAALTLSGVNGSDRNLAPVAS